MSANDITVIRGPDVLSALQGRERSVIDIVREAYVAHQAGQSFLPHSMFVRFPGRERERIIALPGYLGGRKETAGIKWISSFPENHRHGISRASAVIVLNSLETGRPTYFMEGSIVSSARTAASAALAADVIHPKGDIHTLGIIGCGLINREIVRFTAALGRKIHKVVVFDIDVPRSEMFASAIAPLVGGVPVLTRSRVEEVLAESQVVSFATTAVKPTVPSLDMCPKGATILHISLRDLTAEVVLNTDNLVDDVDHAIRAQTSLHLAEQGVGHRDFVRGTLAEIINGSKPARDDSKHCSVFSPFGLGVLDLAVSGYLAELCVAQGKGIRIDGFFDQT